MEKENSASEKSSRKQACLAGRQAEKQFNPKTTEKPRTEQRNNLSQFLFRQTKPSSICRFPDGVIGIDIQRILI